MKVHTMFNDVDVVLERICAIGPVKEVNDDLAFDVCFQVWFASMQMNPNPIWFGLKVERWEKGDEAEALKVELNKHRDELIELVKLV